MREQGLFAQRPRHRTVTTESEKGAQVAPNLLQRDFSAKGPNTKWDADTTCIGMAEGWAMAAIQDATLVAQALHMAIARRRPKAGLLHHSVHGSNYTSESYQALYLCGSSAICYTPTVPN